MNVVQRYKKNPILTKNDIPYPVETVHNAGMTKYNGKYIMLFRSHRRNGRSIIGIAESDDGFKFTARPEPFLVPSTGGVFKEYEEFGVEDCRITHIDGEYLLTYSAYSGTVSGLPGENHRFSNCGTGLAYQPGGYAQRGDFPEKINGLYVRMDRPIPKSLLVDLDEFLS